MDKAIRDELSRTFQVAANCLNQIDAAIQRGDIAAAQALLGELSYQTGAAAHRLAGLQVRTGTEISIKQDPHKSKIIYLEQER